MGKLDSRLRGNDTVVLENVRPDFRKILMGALAALLCCLMAGAGRAADAPPTDAGKAYLDGLMAGEAQGREEGRALELGRTLPADVRSAAEAAFKAGYAAGAVDVFGGYDGGWAMGEPYVVTLAPGPVGITYRIGGRVPMQPGIAYFLCPDGHSLCQAPRK
jgi:hypothetical protein